MDLKKMAHDIKPTKVYAIKCADCEDIIYSRAVHDYNCCTCGKIAIDGGFDYHKIAFSDKKPEAMEISIDASRREMYDDWNRSKNKYGRIKPKKRKAKKSVKKIPSI